MAWPVDCDKLERLRAMIAEEGLDAVVVPAPDNDSYWCMTGCDALVFPVTGEPRAHEPPYAHQAGDGESREGVVLAVEPRLYWADGGRLLLEDNFLITTAGCEQLGSYPDDVRVFGGDR